MRISLVGGPVVRTSPSNVGSVGLISGGSHMPWGQKNTKYKISNNVTNAIKTLKMVHIKKSFKRNVFKLKGSSF